MLIQEDLTLEEKLKILTDAAKYDVACTSSGVDRNGRSGQLGNAASCGICHSFAADGRCVSLLKVLYTNECIYDCKYCVNRISLDTVRTSFTPEEICTLTMEFYRRNYIEGLFLSSGILGTPSHTMEEICRALAMLRNQYHFRGYIHVKAIPGADPALIDAAGHLADRMSINLELPTGDGLRRLAPAKTREKLLTPMRQIQKEMAGNSLILADRKQQKQRSFSFMPVAAGQKVLASAAGGTEGGGAPVSRATESRTAILRPPASYESRSLFVPAGQSTQMIIGATPETDQQILAVTEALYRNFQMKRVFFSAYSAMNEDPDLPAPGTRPPLLREHRLYQADWLLRFYGFSAEELLSEQRPYFNQDLDPKCDWALRHLDRFPVEINKAEYGMLLRVPGIGVRSAGRIMKARRTASLDFADLKKFGVVLKRAGYFITCRGRMLNPVRIEEEYLTQMLTADERQEGRRGTDGTVFRQLSLFDDFSLHPDPGPADLLKAVTGEL